MKIVDIRTIPLSCRCEPPYGSAGGMQARRGALLVEIETDERDDRDRRGRGRRRQHPRRHREAVAADADRRGPAADRGAVAEDVRAHPPIRPPRHRHERDQRHRHRAVGHRRQGRRDCRSIACSAAAATGSRPMPAAASTRRARRSTTSPARPRATAPAASRA